MIFFPITLSKSLASIPTAGLKVVICASVKYFDTGNSGRDENMKRIMRAGSFPEVIVDIISAQGFCSPGDLKLKTECSGLLEGEISINGIKKKIEIKTLLQNKNDSVVAVGSTHFLWSDFNIPDPSTLVSRLSPEVKVNVSVKLPA